MLGRSLMTGVSVGVTVGAMAFELSRKSRRSKKKLRARAAKVLGSLGELVDELSDMF